MAYEEFYGGDPRLAALMRKRKLAEALMAEGSSTAPAASPFVGLSRVATALAGAWQGSMIDDEAKKMGEEGDADLARLKAQALGVDLGGSRAGVADQLIAGSVPTPGQQMVAPMEPVGKSPLPPEELMPLFQQASAETGIPVPILVAQAQTESGFNPNAVSPTGARGVMQVLPSTAQDPGYGVQPVDPSKLSDPSVNIPFAARYLAGRGKEVGVTDWNDPTQAAKGLRAYAGADTPQGDKSYDRKVLGLVPQQGGTTMAFSGQPAPQQAGLPTPVPQQAAPGQAQAQAMMAQAQKLEQSGYEALSSRDPRARKFGEVMLQKAGTLQTQALALQKRDEGTPARSPERFKQDLDIATAGKPTTETRVSVASQNAAVGKAIENYNAFVEAAPNNQKMLATLDAFETAMGGFTPGIGADQRAQFEKAKSFLGLPSGADMAAVMQKGQADLKMAAGQAFKGQGQVSNFERELATSTVELMGNTPDGVRAVSQMIRAGIRRQGEIQAIYEQNAAQNGGLPNLFEIGQAISKLGPANDPAFLAQLQARVDAMRGTKKEDTAPVPTTESGAPVKTYDPKTRTFR